jgi:hypothetical protein
MIEPHGPSSPAEHEPTVRIDADSRALVDGHDGLGKGYREGPSRHAAIAKAPVLQGTALLACFDSAAGGPTVTLAATGSGTLAVVSDPAWTMAELVEWWRTAAPDLS